MAEENKLTPQQKLSVLATKVITQVEDMVSCGRLDLPKNYSAGNAVKQFQLSIQDDAKLMACTKNSLAKCMLDMAILGLNISKKQCYAVPFGGKAQLMVSYLGKVATAKRIDPTIEDVKARTIHAGEEFEFEEDLFGNTHVTKHKRSLSTLAVNDVDKDIVGAYATIIYNDGKEPVSLVMPLSEIKKRWAKSPAKPFDDKGKLKPDSVHFQFPDKMCERTLISAICSPIIAKSNDDDLFGATVQSVDIESAKAEADAEATEKMCEGEYVDIECEFEEVDDDNCQEEKNEDLE